MVEPADELEPEPEPEEDEEEEDDEEAAEAAEDVDDEAPDGFDAGELLDEEPRLSLR